MKRNIMSITTAAALLFATATSAQINLGATTSATVQAATRVGTGSVLRATGSHLQATSAQALNTTRNITTRTTSAVQSGVAKTTGVVKSAHVQANMNTQVTAANANSNSNVTANNGSGLHVDAGAQVNAQPVVDKVAATKDAVVNAAKETADKVKTAAGKTHVSASSSTEVKASAGH